MTQAYVKKLGLTPQLTNIDTQKTDDLPLEIYRIVTVEFSIYNKLSKSRFLEKTFLPTNISIKMVLEMPFPSLSNANL